MDSNNPWPSCSTSTPSRQPIPTTSLPPATGTQKQSGRDERTGKPFTLRYIITHLIAETARHDGHLDFGRELEKRDEGVTTAWWKEERGERIFVDYNQNNRDRTIASAYSLRPIPGAPVSTPMTWDELKDVTDPGEYNLFTVPDRLADGDPWATIDDERHSLEPLLQLFEEQGSVELNYPPDYPKMPGEPPRVQPSKKVAAHWDEDGNRIAD